VDVNRYAYANNDPVNMSDPNGHASKKQGGGWLSNFFSNNGRGPNLRHDLGVRRAMLTMRAAGFRIVTRGPVEVKVPGFPTPRVYDFLARDPITNKLIGVEVKTTMKSTIRLNREQVAKDAVVLLIGGSSNRGPVRLVSYKTFCFSCSSVDVRSAVLKAVLESASGGTIKVEPQQLPGNN
jgi:hypothetical protein